MRPMPHKLLCLALAALPVAALPLSAGAASAADRPDRTLCRSDTSGFASMQGKDVKDGFVDKDGQWILPPSLDHNAYGYLATYETEGEPTEGQFFTFKIGQTYQIVKRDGLPLRLERFAYADQFHDNRAFVKYDNQIQFLDTSGNLAFEGAYGQAYPFSGGMTAVAMDTQQGMIQQSIIDLNGKVIFSLPPSYELADIDGEALAAGRLSPLRQDGKQGYIDSTGKMVIPATFDRAYPFKDDLAPVVRDQKYGFINQTGALVVPFLYDVALEFSEGLIPVKKDGKFGALDAKGDIAIPFDFTGLGIFSDGVAPASKGNMWGYIDHSGAWVIEPQFKIATLFSEGFARVVIDGRDILIDKTGRDILAEDHGFNTPYTTIQSCGQGLYTVKARGYPGYVADVREGRLTPIQDPTEAMHGFNLLLAALYSDNPVEMLAFADSLADQDQDAWAKTFYQSIVLNFPRTRYAEDAAEKLE